MINLFIADDHPIVREGLKRIIMECPDIELIDEAVNGDEVLAKIGNSIVDVLLLDISMPGMGFLELIPRLKQKQPDLKVLVLSMYSEDHYALRALRAGANGYLTKDRSSEELAYAIRHIYKGNAYVTDSLAEILATELNPNHEKNKHEILSNREFEVLCMLGSGMRIIDISNKIALSPKTVSTYHSRIFQKMKFNNDAELIHYAIKNELTD
jgi:two-component system, NarL family, invasion response regulator UvrY